MFGLNMKANPLVSVGIPTYNRATLLKRSIESVLNQNYDNIELIVSDNASTDDTESICRYFINNVSCFKYIKQSSNRGPGANFQEVLNNASGDYFMWLGDDDWIDSTYVSACIQQLLSDQDIVLAYGKPEYYRNGQKSYTGKVFSLLQDTWWNRVIAYYLHVADNGMVYGVMRSQLIRKVVVPFTLGGDWLMIANIAAMGKIKVIPSTTVHRELGGMTASYQNIVNTVGIPKYQAKMPMLSTAVGACIDIVVRGIAFKYRPILLRLVVAAFVFVIVLLHRPKELFFRIVKKLLL